MIHDVLESIVALTEQRDQRSLELSLVNSLKEMVEGAHGWLLELGPTEDATFRQVGDGEALPTEVLAAARGMLDGGEAQVIRHGGVCYLITPALERTSDAIRMLVLAQQEWSEADTRLVRGMLKVYQNFVSLLYDSEKDTLTGLYNRRKFENALNSLVAARLNGRRLHDLNHGDFLAILDLDHFKRINDTYGHLIGDEVLLTFANILRRTLREADQCFRYGGEEFVVLIQDVSPAAALAVLERIRQNVATHAFPQVGRVTLSIGASLVDEHLLPTEIIDQADRALYFSKENGRNQVRYYHDLVANGDIQQHQALGSIELF